jgi:uncharacterized delta-60 repeat protein
MSIIKALSFALAFSLAAAAIAQPGTIDPSFNGGTAVVVTTGVWGAGANGGYGVLNAAVVQSSGKVVALGRCNNPHGLGAIRFNLDGTIDTTFGQGGTFDQPYGTYTNLPPGFQSDTGNGAIGGAVGPGGRIILIDDKFQFVCLTADGALDTTFGTGGRFSLYSTGKRYWSGRCVAFQPDGKIVAAGSSIPQNPHNNQAVTIARLNANGSLDTTFANFGHGSTPGYLVGPLVPSGGMASGNLIIQPDGKILVGGNSSSSFMARYLPSGAIDTSFGVGGTRTLSFSGSNDVPIGMALAGDGRIVVKSVMGQTVYVARYTSAGAIDTSFGGYSSGWTSFSVPTGGRGQQGVALQSDGSVLLPLNWPEPIPATTTDQAAFRLTAAGFFDSSFGTSNSGLSQPVGWPGQNEGATWLTQDSLGRIILVGAHANADGTGGGIMVSALRGQ